MLVIANYDPYTKKNPSITSWDYLTIMFTYGQGREKLGNIQVTWGSLGLLPRTRLFSTNFHTSPACCICAIYRQN